MCDVAGCGDPRHQNHRKMRPAVAEILDREAAERVANGTAEEHERILKRAHSVGQKPVHGRPRPKRKAD